METADFHVGSELDACRRPAVGGAGHAIDERAGGKVVGILVVGIEARRHVAAFLRRDARRLEERAAVPAHRDGVIVGNAVAVDIAKVVRGAQFLREHGFEIGVRIRRGFGVVFGKRRFRGNRAVSDLRHDLQESRREALSVAGRVQPRVEEAVQQRIGIFVADATAADAIDRHAAADRRALHVADPVAYG